MRRCGTLQKPFTIACALALYLLEGTGHSQSMDSSTDQAALFAIAEAWVERYKEGDARGIAAGVTIDGQIRFLRQQGLLLPTE